MCARDTVSDVGKGTSALGRRASIVVLPFPPPVAAWTGVEKETDFLCPSSESLIGPTSRSLFKGYGVDRHARWLAGHKTLTDLSSIIPSTKLGRFQRNTLAKATQNPQELFLLTSYFTKMQASLVLPFPGSRKLWCAFPSERQGWHQLSCRFLRLQ